MTIPQALQLVIDHYQAKRLEEAESLCRQILAAEPDQPEALHFLGVISRQKGLLPQAADLIRRSLALRPDFNATVNLALTLQDLKDFPNAVKTYLLAIAMSPDNPDLHNNLGNSYRMLGQLDLAVDAYKKALSLNPRSAQAWYNLAISLMDLLQPENAAQAYFQALSFDPNFASAHYNLGNCLSQLNRSDEAARHYLAALKLKPDHAPALNNLGHLYKSLGFLDLAIDAFQKSVDADPHCPVFHSNLIFSLNYSLKHTPADIQNEHKLWNSRHALRPQPLVSPVNPDPNRKLRVGFVSPDFHDHPITRFIPPLFNNLDRDSFEIFAYIDVPRPDHVTRSIQSISQNWRDISRLSNDSFIQLVKEDRIDILVDLSSHSGGNRLPAFSLKPAPIQISWLAYCGSTGLSAIDYRISDPLMDPPGMFDPFYSEKTVLLPDCYWCYQASPFAPNPQFPSALTFGSFNTACKINDAVLCLWAKILNQLPEASLLLFFQKGSAQTRAADTFRDLGVDPTRIRFFDRLPIPDYYALYNQVLIALDPFPFNGGTTTCDALYMGVPVVSRVYPDRAVGRAGLSLLSQVGLTDLAADSDDAYVNAAVQLAQNTPRLRDLRFSLRQTMISRPLMDAPRFARNFGNLLRNMWTHHDFTR